MSAPSPSARRPALPVLRRRRAGGPRAGPRSVQLHRSERLPERVRRGAWRPPPRSSTPAPTPSPTPAPAFPVTLTDDEGGTVALAAEPQKIVSLTPAVTETLFAVGAGDRVVATDDSSDFPGRGKGSARRGHVRDGRRREDRQPQPRPRDRGRRRLHVGRRHRAAPRRQDPGARRVDPVDRWHLQGHRARRHGRRRVRGGCRDHDRDAGRHAGDRRAAQAESGKADDEAARLLRRRLHRHDRPDLRPGRGLVPRRDGRPPRQWT